MMIKPAPIRMPKLKQLWLTMSEVDSCLFANFFLRALSSPSLKLLGLENWSAPSLTVLLEVASETSTSIPYCQVRSLSVRWLFTEDSPEADIFSFFSVFSSVETLHCERDDTTLCLPILECRPRNGDCLLPDLRSSAHRSSTSPLSIRSGASLLIGLIRNCPKTN